MLLLMYVERKEVEREEKKEKEKSEKKVKKKPETQLQSILFSIQVSKLHVFMCDLGCNFFARHFLLFIEK